jgi:hypothetical protein
MAMLVYFEKVREDDRTIEYRFGYPELDRRLVIDKASQEGQPMDGNRNPAFSAVYVKIIRLLRGEQTWPAGGTYAA